jgi:hypothetical protein
MKETAKKAGLTQHNFFSSSLLRPGRSVATLAVVFHVQLLNTAFSGRYSKIASSIEI